MNFTNLFLRHNYITVPEGNDHLPQDVMATIMMNFSYYGYSFNHIAFDTLMSCSKEQLIDWWKDIETELKAITGESRNMGDFVVYKNFPQEVLDKSQSEYWMSQIAIYWGYPASFFSQPVEPRKAMSEQPKCKVLQFALAQTASIKILQEYIAMPARWKEEQLKDVLFLIGNNISYDISKIAFKENLIQLVSFMMSEGKKLPLRTATDVLRLGVALSDGDVSLAVKTKFRKFKRTERQYLLSMLNECSNLQEDFARRPEMWKKFLYGLHCGDYKNKYPQVCKAMDLLYKGELITFNGEVERLILNKDEKVLLLLKERPGEFRRRLVHMLNLFQEKAADAFVTSLKGLTTAQLLSTRTFLSRYNSRQFRVFPPKGNWNKMQIVSASENKIKGTYIAFINDNINNIIKQRVPAVKVLDPATSMIKLPSNGSEVSAYNRGTVFPIPEGITFLRTASYWKQSGYTCWYDNGWNFFDKDWKGVGSCCWDHVKFGGNAAIFSGDPVNTSNKKGQACQLIDIYLDKLTAAGVRYAVWNILCFSHRKFSQAEDVFALLQWGEDAQSGKLIEPARSQLAFPLTGNSLTKYIAMVDVKERKLIYLDANLKGKVGSASNNQASLEKSMPAFMEYIDSLPSVHDLFSESVSNNGEGLVLYSDKDVNLASDKAYVFSHENKNNKYNPININSLL